ncbi:hypothetical protein AB9F46_35100, partial [Rhizobium leguminosarum]|uniref:hypothetical protein n=1 Tax=Rhizobium leguminosarum TaxID=384 RepID=UPI003F9D1D88
MSAFDEKLGRGVKKDMFGRVGAVRRRNVQRRKPENIFPLRAESLADRSQDPDIPGVRKDDIAKMRNRIE